MAFFKLDTEDRAEVISRNMAIIMNPSNVDSVYLFGWGTDSDGQVYIDVPLDMVCPVYVNENFAQVMTDVGNLLGIPQQEGQQLRQYLEGGQVLLGNLIPSTLEQFIPNFKHELFK